MKQCVCKFWLTASALPLLLYGCSNGGGQTPQSIVQSDLAGLYAAPVTQALDLEDAIVRALENNLDARIAQQDYLVTLSDADLQKLNALPTITARREFITRSNSGASSSVSAETGVQSLEPSISTDQSRLTSTLEANWQVLDSAINIYRAKSAVDRAVIAEERLRKVRQNIIMDTYSAFWRLATAQVVKPDIDAALALSQMTLASLDTAQKNGDMPFDEIASRQQEILVKRARLKEIDEQLALSSLELKALISVPAQNPLTLNVDERWLALSRLPVNPQDTAKFVEHALENRPEIREELLNLKIAERNVNAAVYETIPGLNLLVTGNQDNNSFLEDEEWLSLTAGISASITRLLTLPARFEKAEKEVDLSHARRKALVAAVISQVHIADILLNQARASFAEEKRSFAISEKRSTRSRLYEENGLLNSIEGTSNRLDYEIARIELYDALTSVHLSLARLMNAAGFDLEEFLNLALPGITGERGQGT